MKDYRKSEYAKNKMNRTAIVYTHTGEVEVRLTFEKVSIDQPEITEEEFQIFKDASDEFFRIIENNDSREERKKACSFSEEIERLIKNGTKVNKDVVIENKELYKQYLVIFNQVDKRYYTEDSSNSKIQNMKDQLWKNPLWRGFIAFLQTTGIMKVVKKTGINTKIKKQITKKIK